MTRWGSLPYLAIACLASFAITAQADAASSRSTAGNDAHLRPALRTLHNFAASPSAYPTITFDDVPEGTTITNQYQADGVIFTSPVFTSEDQSNPTSPVLSGEPRFEGEIEGTFVNPATGAPQEITTFTLDVGYINNRDSVQVEAWDGTGNVVQSVEADEFGINTLTLAYKGMVGFSVHEVSSEPAGFAIDNLTIDPTGDAQQIQSVAALGDSYSSGEGLEQGKGVNYDCGTDLSAGLYYEDTTLPSLLSRPWGPTDCDTRNFSNTEPPPFSRPSRYYDNTCHRDGLAYPRQIITMLGAPQSIFLACSGATTANIGEISETAKPQHPNSPVNVAGGNTQATDLINFDDDHLGGGDPDLITIGVGGNDAGFASIAKSCVVTLKPCSSDTDFVDTVRNKIDGPVYDALESTFFGLRDEHPGSTIVAFGYPSPVSGDTPDCLAASLFQADREYLQDTVLPDLNQAIADAAAAAGVSYVDISRVTEGHELCTAEPWFRGLSLPIVESFHPTQKAHHAIAEYFKAHYTDGHGKLLIDNPPFQGDPIPPVLFGVEGSIGNLQGGPSISCGAGCVQSVPCIESCNVLIQGSGYSPGAQLEAVLHSTERDLGALTADGQGNVEAYVEIPSGVEPGEHIITLNGTGPFGEPQYGSLGVDVLEGLGAPVPSLPATSPIGNSSPLSNGAAARVLGSTAARLPVRATVRLKLQRGHLSARVTCPTSAVSACTVTLTLQQRHVRRGHLRYVTVRHAALLVAAGKVRSVSLPATASAAARRKLRLLATTSTSAGVLSQALQVPVHYGTVH